MYFPLLMYLQILEGSCFFFCFVDHFDQSCCTSSPEPILNPLADFLNSSVGHVAVELVAGRDASGGIDFEEFVRAMDRLVHGDIGGRGRLGRQSPEQSTAAVASPAGVEPANEQEGDEENQEEESEEMPVCSSSKCMEVHINLMNFLMPF